MIPHLPIPARFRIYLRFVHYLVWEFRWPLGVLVTLVLGGGTTLWLCYHHEPLSFSRACRGFPDALPGILDRLSGRVVSSAALLRSALIGLGAVADSFIRLAFLVFSRKQNQLEWNRMLT